MQPATLISSSDSRPAIFGTRLTSLSRRGNNPPIGAKNQTGRSSCAAWAYLSRSEVWDIRQQLKFDFSARREEDLVGVIWLRSDWAMQHNIGASPSSWWNAVEDAEHRYDAETAKEFRVDYPRAFSDAQLAQVHKAVMQVAIAMLANNDLVLDVIGGTIHRSKASDGGSNPHGDVLFSVREINRGATEKTGALVFSRQKYSKLSRKAGSKLWSEIREAIASTVREHGLVAGLSLDEMIDIDHRTLDQRRADAIERAADLENPDNEYAAIMEADAIKSQVANLRARANYWDRPAARKVGPVRHRRAVLVADRHAGYPVKVSEKTKISDAKKIQWSTGRERVADAADASALRLRRWTELQAAKLEASKLAILTASAVAAIEKFAQRLWALMMQTKHNASKQKSDVQAIAPDRANSRTPLSSASKPVQAPQPQTTPMRAPVSAVSKPAEKIPLPPLNAGLPVKAVQTSPSQPVRTALPAPATITKAVPSVVVDGGAGRTSVAPEAAVKAEQRAKDAAAAVKPIVSAKPDVLPVTAAPARETVIKAQANPSPPDASKARGEQPQSISVTTERLAVVDVAIASKSAAPATSAPQKNSGAANTAKLAELPKFNTAAEQTKSDPSKVNIKTAASAADVPIAQLAAERHMLDNIFRRIVTERLSITRSDGKITIAGLGEPDHALLNAPHYANGVESRLTGIEKKRLQETVDASVPNKSLSNQAAAIEAILAPQLAEIRRKERARHDRDVLDEIFARIVRENIRVKKTEKGWTLGTLSDVEKAALKNTDLRTMVLSRLEGILKKQTEAATVFSSGKGTARSAIGPVSEQTPPKPEETVPTVNANSEKTAASAADDAFLRMMQARNGIRTR